MVWWHSTAFCFSAHPFRQVIQGNYVPTAHNGHSDSLLRLFPSASKREPSPAPIPSNVRELLPPSPTYLHQPHFSIYGPAFQMVRLDYKITCISKCQTTPRQLSQDFRTEDRTVRS
ncbi:hypothetical protein AVEN_172589-1 [Araneus ventricosus]|uniref:Uncharacterized protein n=1 Tax=Araneus ventricosus TaxID=182803 RepID=A0A4Y2QZN0_ARAVE|nr:hypothetical protein AVEN_55197-1 [Araneus ventricosus]GBN68778.1 hypothetical protein AVEN_172589-1 [Araneus ventricosus]